MELDKLAPAMVALQASLTPVGKSADNPFFKSKYAPLPEVRAAMQPLLAANDLALVTMPAIIDGKNALRFYLLHASGQHLSGEWLLTPTKNDPQGEGSDTTYKRRYGEMAITGSVADDDDDGNAASTKTGTTKTIQKASPLEVAKSELRAAIKSSGADPVDYAWVKDATDSDLGTIRGTAEALKLGKAVAK